MWTIRGLESRLPGAMIPVLPFAPIGREFYCFAIRAVECLVDIQHCLNRVVSWRNIFDGCARIALRRFSNQSGIARFPAINCHAKNHLRFRRIVNLHPRLFARVV